MRAEHVAVYLVSWLAAAMITLAAVILYAPCYEARWGETFDHERLEVSDAPLLTDAERMEALRTDAASFTVGGVHYVIESGARDALADYLKETITG